MNIKNTTEASLLPECFYDSESEYYMDVKLWESLNTLYNVLKVEQPPKPVWRPSKKFLEDQKGFNIE